MGMRVLAGAVEGRVVGWSRRGRVGEGVCVRVLAGLWEVMMGGSGRRDGRVEIWWVEYSERSSAGLGGCGFGVW